MTKPKCKDPDPIGQVFQGKYMREGASFWDTVFYSYAWPLLESSMTEPIQFEQFGELPERLHIKHEELKIEKAIKYYIAKDPTDRLAFMKALIAVNKIDFLKFIVVRFVVQIDDFIHPFIISSLIEWIQSAKEESIEDTLSMIGLAMTIPVL